MESPRNRRTQHRAVFVMGTMAVAGVLIWSKLRLATNIPRSAYATPENASVEPADGAEPAAGPDAGADRAGSDGAAARLESD